MWFFQGSRRCLWTLQVSLLEAWAANTSAAKMLPSATHSQPQSDSNRTTMAAATLLPGLEDHDPQYYTRFDNTERHLLDTISIISAYECTVHDPRKLCNCPVALRPITAKYKDLLLRIHFLEEWRQHLLKHNACFDFTLDKAGKKAFRNTTGSSAYEFARQIAVETFEEPAMTAPKYGSDTMIGAMYAYWAAQATAWRSKYRDALEARRKAGACQRGDPGEKCYRDFSASDPRYPPQIGKRLVLQRVCLYGTNDGLHATTL